MMAVIWPPWHPLPEPLAKNGFVDQLDGAGRSAQDAFERVEVAREVAFGVLVRDPVRLARDEELEGPVLGTFDQHHQDHRGVLRRARCEGPSAIPSRTIRVSSGTIRVMSRSRIFSRKIAFSSDIQTSMSDRTSALRSVFQRPMSEKTRVSLAAAGRLASSMTGATVASAASVIRSTTASSRACFESK